VKEFIEKNHQNKVHFWWFGWSRFSLL